MSIFDIEISRKIYLPLIIIVVAIVFNIVLGCIINSKIKLGNKLSKHEQRSRKTLLLLIKNIIKTLIIVISILSILQVLGVNTSALVASATALSLVAGLAFQDILKDYLVGALIIIESQFAIGEIVQINDFKGEVIELTLRTTKLKSITGETCIIPNRSIGSVINYSLADALVIVNVSVSYESDLDNVEKVLNKLCINLKKEISEIKGDIVLDGLDSLDDSSISFRISTHSSAKNVSIVKRKILKEVKLMLDKNNINIPYPQIEVHYEK